MAHFGFYYILKKQQIQNSIEKLPSPLIVQQKQLQEQHDQPAQQQNQNIQTTSSKSEPTQPSYQPTYQLFFQPSYYQEQQQQQPQQPSYPQFEYQSQELQQKQQQKPFQYQNQQQQQQQQQQVQKEAFQQQQQQQQQLVTKKQDQLEKKVQTQSIVLKSQQQIKQNQENDIMKKKSSIELLKKKLQQIQGSTSETRQKNEQLGKSNLKLQQQLSESQKKIKQMQGQKQDMQQSINQNDQIKNQLREQLEQLAQELKRKEEEKIKEDSIGNRTFLIESSKVCKSEEFLRDRGAFAQVFQNHNIQKNKTLAQKTISQTLKDMPVQDMIRLFKDAFNEMNIMVKLKQTSSKQIIDLIAMSFSIQQSLLDQENHILNFSFYSEEMYMNLDQFITQNKNKDRKLNVYILKEIALGIKCMHDQDIIHGDIKPSNILLDETVKDVKIVDYGTSKLLEFKQVNLYSSQIICTPKYSPKEIQLLRLYSKKADIYGFGCVMFSLFTGKEPYCNIQGINIWTNSVIEYYKANSKIYNNYSLDKDLEDLIIQCTQVEQEKRLIDINGIIESLQKL